MLKGKNITIRTVMEADLPELFLLIRDIDILGDFLPMKMISEAKFKKDFAEHGFITDSLEKYLITNKSDEMIGAIWTFKAVPYYDAVEVGY
ncbi:MAG: GNAT family N-acetyltransferase, partial [Chromatiales bacterium]|nr:GNAT family N-acetyltransferase [Chromatiales bacterium]